MASRFPLGARHYELLGKISSTVFKARCSRPDEIVAIIILSPDHLSFVDVEILRLEAQFTEHENLLKAHCYFLEDSSLWIVMPYMCSCLNLLTSAYPDGLEEPVIAALLREILKALVYLHKECYLHRDVKVLQKTLENSFKKKFSKPFRELVGACVVNDPHKRPTAAKLLDFSFFQRACYNAWTDLIKSSEKQRTKNDFLRGEKLEKEIEKPEGEEIEKPEGEEIENGDDSDTETKAEEEIENGDDSDTETETKAGEEPEDDDNERDDSDTETKAEEELEDDDNERDDPDPDPDPDTNKGRALSEEGGD